MIAVDHFADQVVDVLRPEHNEIIEALLVLCLNEPFHVGDRVGRAIGRLLNSDKGFTLPWMSELKQQLEMSLPDDAFP